jgi:hypothetical protein
VKVDLEIRYSNPELSQLLELASFLDPRFKLGYVSDRESTLKEVEEQIRGASNDVTDGEGGPSSASGDDGSSASEPPRKKKPKGLSKILAKRLGATSRIGLTTEENIKQELDQYLSHPQLEMEDSPLDWWKVQHSRYPWLAKLARKYLCICATSVPFEHVFSYAGHIVSDQRST